MNNNTGKRILSRDFESDKKDDIQDDDYSNLIRAEKCLEIAIDNRKLEIELLWKRTVVFWGFISILFVAMYNISPSHKIYIAWIGFVFSVMWNLVNKGSKSWQQSWEIKTEYYFREIFGYKELYKKAHETDLIGIKNDSKLKLPWLHRLFRMIPILESGDYSMSKLLIGISNFYVCIWVGVILFYSKIPIISMFIRDNREFIVPIFCVLYLIFIYFASKSREINNADSFFNLDD